MELPKCLLELINEKSYLFSKHFTQRQLDRNLRTIDIQAALKNGQVIEHIERLNQGHKYVIYAEENNLYFHIVLLYCNNNIVLKTIYVPDRMHFQNDLKTRRTQL